MFNRYKIIDIGLTIVHIKLNLNIYLIKFDLGQTAWLLYTIENLKQSLYTYLLQDMVLHD